ncbi:MAG: DUF5320 domain-containing protein [Bacteroidales bacterium]
MPGFDRTGPEGQGPMTGRKLGRCNPNAPENTDNVNERTLPGRGLGLAQRRGRGAGRPRGDDGLGIGLARRRGFGRQR